MEYLTPVHFVNKHFSKQPELISQHIEIKFYEMKVVYIWLIREIICVIGTAFINLQQLNN